MVTCRHFFKELLQFCLLHLQLLGSQYRHDDKELHWLIDNDLNVFPVYLAWVVEEDEDFLDDEGEEFFEEPRRGWDGLDDGLELRCCGCCLFVGSGRGADD